MAKVNAVAIKEAQRLMDAHYVNACSDDRQISAGDSPIYQASLKAFLDAAEIAYPDVHRDDVYDTYVDACGDSLFDHMQAFRAARALARLERQAIRICRRISTMGEVEAFNEIVDLPLSTLRQMAYMFAMPSKGSRHALIKRILQVRHTW